VSSVLHIAHERATLNGRSVDDTLRIWFHVLLAAAERTELE
jgi:hypothetical protein